MKMDELKIRVHESWKRYLWFEEAISQPDSFKADIRKEFGDLRYKETWESALARYRGLNAQIGLLDASSLILNALNFTPERWDYEYRHSIFDEFMMLPDGLDLIRVGLEELYSATYTPQEREKADGFFRLVQEQSSNGRLNGESAQLIGCLQGVDESSTG